jgi:hypothetical protein
MTASSAFSPASCVMPDTGRCFRLPPLMKRMTPRFRFAAFALLCLLTGLATAKAEPPKPYTAEYEVLRNGSLMGRGTVTLRQDGRERWELRSVTRGTEGLAGLAGAEITEHSTLRWIDDRPESRSYRYRQDLAWRSRERSIDFDSAQNRVVSRDRRGEHVFAFAPGALDRQSVMLALARDLAAGKREMLSYVVADRDEFGPERYRVGAEETVQTPAGALRALRVERLRDEPRGRSTVNWFGIEQGFLPVRVLQTEPDGDSFEMRLISLDR